MMELMDVSLLIMLLRLKLNMMYYWGLCLILMWSVEIGSLMNGIFLSENLVDLIGRIGGLLGKFSFGLLVRSI